ncbi:MAG: hypothetical protein LPK02_07200 [Rhodobacterales bacterium]|nr:hypothetical protein [Rhodobacterales bacterium]
MKRKDQNETPPKPRDPAAHLRSQGALRQRIVVDGKKSTSGERSRVKAQLKKVVEGDE